MPTKTVLLIGARGFLGTQILDAILAKNDKNAKSSYQVKVLIREGSDASQLESKEGLSVVRGDVMKPETLVDAMENVDVVIHSANGYMSGHPEVDTEGCRNVVDAVKAKGVSRLIYCSILKAEKASKVEHFHHKFLGEEYMKEQNVPFVALRPGCFLDQADDYLGDAIQRNWSYTVCPWDKTVAVGMIHTADLAKLFADAVDLPPDADRKSIDVGWSRPVSYIDIVKIVNDKLNRNMGVIALPWWFRTALKYTVGWISVFATEMLDMFDFFSSGVYVNDIGEQEKYFGKAPTPEEVIGRYVDNLLKDKEDEN
jgi:uncharacterized protein YbjT (DUF2867 family)